MEQLYKYRINGQQLWNTAKARNDGTISMRRNELTVSALVPTYNCAHLICDAIDSLLAQTRPPDEVIVVDDASTDQTELVLRRYGDKIRYLRLNKNLKPAGARNAGLAVASHPWILFLDSDDLLIETHLAEVCRILEANPSLVWAAGLTVTQRSLNGPIEPIVSQELVEASVNTAEVVEDYFAASATGVTAAICGFLIRKDVIEALGGFDPALHHGSDNDMWWKIACAHPPIGLARKPGYVYRRVRDDSTTVTFQKDYAGFCDLLEHHLERTQKVGRRYAYEKVARRSLDSIAYATFYEDDVALLRRIAKRHAKLLSPGRRLPIQLAAMLPGPGRSLLRHLLQLRLKMLGRTPIKA
jgi:glycosyltransferase involved in cell wall biosynthesis